MSLISYLDKLAQFVFIVLSVASVVFLSPVLVIVIFGFTLVAFVILEYDSRFLICMAIFMILLTVAFSVGTRPDLANQTAVSAYYFLAIGVIGLLIDFKRNQRPKKSE